MRFCHLQLAVHITSSAHNDSVTYLGLSRPYRAHQDIKMASKDPKMSKQGTAGKRKHVTLTIPYKLQIIASLESGESQKEVMASYKSGMSIIHDKQKWKEKL